MWEYHLEYNKDHSDGEYTSKEAAADAAQEEHQQYCLDNHPDHFHTAWVEVGYLDEDGYCERTLLTEAHYEPEKTDFEEHFRQGDYI